MRSVLPTMRIPRPAVQILRPFTCRVCGCTSDHACIVDSADIPIELAYTCSWAEHDLCTRCHGPRRPTRRQALELARLEQLKGELRVTPAGRPGCLVVALLKHDDGGTRPPPLFLMGPRGAVGAL